MASKKSKVYLAFEDEVITKNNQSVVDFSTNKVGGIPDWYEQNQMENPHCQLCGLTLPLIVQIYAPLMHSCYHRTLYLFGCINPDCWNRKESWICLRGQMLDTTPQQTGTEMETLKSFDWCEGANSWEDVANESFTGKQVINSSTCSFNEKMETLHIESNEKMSSIGATDSNPFSATATAEFEANEDETVVTIDTPSEVLIDALALFKNVKPVPEVVSKLEFTSFFISIDDEDQSKTVVNMDLNLKNLPSEEDCNPFVLGTDVKSGEEAYEKALPPHGDKLFHSFVSRIQKNPGQLLRYIREGGSPLYLYPEKDIPQSCLHCAGALTYELQLLPTLLTRLELRDCGMGHIEFGTVLVLTCQQSCWATGDTVRSEYVIVQKEM